ncbi:hypothetical protein PVAP13_8KG294700 [Panicum virgatum]|uniref:Uncharacterized protein n=1 Tax=Panicum virgatum TaxID=38727 RepID=A0A8T0PKH7_PANVG|nr:hypothetical protein PVAP13_8KG294700 [Panicum virgatum]
MESLGLVNPKIVYTCWDFVYFSLRPQPLDKYESRSMETRPRHCVFASRGQRGWTIAFLKRGQFPSCIEIGHAPTAAMIDRRKIIKKDEDHKFLVEAAEALEKTAVGFSS